MRDGHHSDLLELELSRRKIPFVKYGGIRYMEAAHVKDFLALLRVATNPDDQLSWFRLLQLLDGVGPVIAKRLFDELLSDKPGAPAGRRCLRRACNPAGRSGRGTGRAAQASARAIDPGRLSRRRDPTRRPRA